MMGKEQNFLFMIHPGHDCEQGLYFVLSFPFPFKPNTHTGFFAMNAPIKFIL